jgi:hypothetical protein
MGERKKENRGGAVAVFIFIGLNLALPPVAYVLSYGPGVWLTSHGYLSEDVLEVIYAPLLFLGGEFSWIGDSIIWYASFWSA